MKVKIKTDNENRKITKLKNKNRKITKLKNKNSRGKEKSKRT